MLNSVYNVYNDYFTGVYRLPKGYTHNTRYIYIRESFKVKY